MYCLGDYTLQENNSLMRVHPRYVKRGSFKIENCLFDHWCWLLYNFAEDCDVTEMSDTSMTGAAGTQVDHNVDGLRVLNLDTCFRYCYNHVSVCMCCGDWCQGGRSQSMRKCSMKNFGSLLLPQCLHTLFFECLPHENHPSFLKSLGHRHRPQII